MKKPSDLLPRVVSALVLFPVVLALCYFGGWPFLALLVVVALICAWEFNSMALTEAPRGLRWFVLLVSGLAPLITSPVVAAIPLARQAPLLLPWCVVILFVLVIFAGRESLESLPAQAGLALLGMAYVGGLFAVLGALRGEGFFWLVLAMGVTWPGDTGAYFAGRAFGKRPLSVHISPKKTWEGFVGGVVGSVAGVFLVWRLSLLFPTLDGGSLQLGVASCLGLGVAGGIVGPLGDLAESLLKRAFQVKDSGSLIPGHGGFLDRVDAFLFNGLVLWTASLLWF